MDRFSPRKKDRNFDFRVFKDVNHQVAHFAAGAEILGPGAISHVMYIVQKGIVAVELDGAFVTQVSDGEIFGELGIVDPQPHTARISAVTDVELYVIDEAQFLALVTKAPMFALRVMRVLATRLRVMNARLLDALNAAA